MTTIRITDDSTKADIAEALTHYVARARREYPVHGTEGEPSAYDLRHQAIDMLLEDYMRAPVGR